MKWFERCTLCNTIIFTWWRKPARVEMYCSDGTIKGPICNYCEKVANSYAEAMKSLKELDERDKEN